jgi:hypothetical protein
MRVKPMSRPYNYGAVFVSGVMGMPGSVALPYLEVKDNEFDHDLLLHQRGPWPEGEEGRLSREQLHRLVDAWIDGVEFK